MLIEYIVNLLIDFILEIIYIILFSSPDWVQLPKLCRVKMKSLKKSVT